MKVNRLSVAAVLLSILVIQPVVAEEGTAEFNFLGSGSVSYKNITFDLPAVGASFEPSLITLGLHGTLSYGNFFTTINYDDTISDDTQYSNGGSLLLMSRQDADLSFGYYLGRGFSAFAGYKDGELNVDVIGEIENNMPVAPYAVVFTDKGPYVGASYTYAMTNSSLSFSLAYADMDGDVAFGTGATSGDTTGFSYNMAWNIPVGENTTFISKLNLTRYDFDDKEKGTVDGSNNPQDLSFEQEFNVLSFAIAHYF